MNNTLTAIKGLLVGHYTDLEAATGCTVIICPEGVVTGVDVRGSSPGTRGAALLNPVNSAPVVHAILLTGGSAYGLDAAGGVMRWLEEKNIGFDVTVGVVPIVSAAVLFDLVIGRFDVRPGPTEGYAACQTATAEPVAEGNVGAGTGATVGKVLGPPQATKGGIGSASCKIAGGITVAALVAVNAFGDVVASGDDKIIAGARHPAGGGFVNTVKRIHGDLSGTMLDYGQNTTLAVVATDAVLTNAEATKVAQMAHDGLAQTIRPVHTMLDGDAVFALSTGQTGKTADINAIGVVAASVLAKAVIRAVDQAEGLAGIPAANELKDVERSGKSTV